jgi:hypothetical protein
MAGKPGGNMDPRPAKKAASPGSSGKRVNIYVTIFSSILFQSQWSHSVSFIRKHHSFRYPRSQNTTDTKYWFVHLFDYFLIFPSFLDTI